jgi:hypothetical protein
VTLPLTSERNLTPTVSVSEYQFAGTAELPQIDIAVLAADWIVVESVAVAVADPPPDTLAAFTCGDVALLATFAVTVIAG